MQYHIKLLETSPETVNALLLGLEYLINISYVDDTEVFKVFFWFTLALYLFSLYHLLIFTYVHSSFLSISIICIVVTNFSDYDLSCLWIAKITGLSGLLEHFGVGAV